MTERSAKRASAARPGDAESWVRAPEPSVGRPPAAEFTARLTIDVTPALSGRTKIAAFQRGLTVAHMLRALLDRKFPQREGAAP